MQTRKFDELISYFNRKVVEMSIDTKYKMELLGMVTALGVAHEKELTAQPEPLSDAYVIAVWKWLLNYQVKAAELNGRYTPYEVLSWVANDWRKEHERSN